MAASFLKKVPRNPLLRDEFLIARRPDDTQTEERISFACPKPRLRNLGQPLLRESTPRDRPDRNIAVEIAIDRRRANVLGSGTAETLEPLPLPLPMKLSP
jgi:hypothetical protein